MSYHDHLLELRVGLKRDVSYFHHQHQNELCLIYSGLDSQPHWFAGLQDSVTDDEFRLYGLSEDSGPHPIQRAVPGL